MAIELNEMQQAEPRQCGSCDFFQPRQPGDGAGICRFRLPPCWQIQTRNSDEIDGRTVRDTQGCDFWRPKLEAGEPAQFVQKRYWHAGMPSR